jgi:hypothetical protein
LLAVPGSPVSLLVCVGRSIGGISVEVSSTLVCVSVGAAPAPGTPRLNGLIGSPPLAIVAPRLVEVLVPLCGFDITVPPVGVPVLPLVVVPLLSFTSPADLAGMVPVQLVMEPRLGPVQALVCLASGGNCEVVLQKSPLCLGVIVLCSNEISVRGVLDIAVVLGVVPLP